MARRFSSPDAHNSLIILRQRQLQHHAKESSAEIAGQIARIHGSCFAASVAQTGASRNFSPEMLWTHQPTQGHDRLLSVVEHKYDEEQLSGLCCTHDRRSDRRRVETLCVAHAAGREWCGHDVAWPLPSTSCPCSCCEFSASLCRVVGRTPFALYSPVFRRSQRNQTAIAAIPLRRCRTIK